MSCSTPPREIAKKYKVMLILAEAVKEAMTGQGQDTSCSTIEKFW